jgi:hypothetical protein
MWTASRSIARLAHDFDSWYISTMSGTQAVTFPVEDWLRALEREEQRLLVVYVCLDAALALVGLAMIVVALLWPLPEDYPITLNVFLGGLIIFAALMASPPVFVRWYKRTCATAPAPVAASPLCTRLLTGEITGNELPAALPGWLRWLAPPIPAPNPDRVVRRVTGASLFYQGYAWPIWDSSLLPIVLGCIVWSLAAGMGPGAEANLDLRSVAQFGVVMQILGSGTAIPILLLLGSRGQSLSMELPMLKRQCQAALARSTEQR